MAIRAKLVLEPENRRHDIHRRHERPREEHI